ncbi:MAG: glucosaminidase domain-containing protein [Bacteroidales bacterium]
MKKIVIISFLFIHVVSFAQYSDAEVNQYVEQYKSLALDAMKAYKIPASIKLAQAIYSSNVGKNKVSIEAHNHFGVLCHVGYTGETYYETPDSTGECYRKYKTVEESYRDHSLFLTQRPRYQNLFLLKTTDYVGWANGLLEVGYSINPTYAQKLIDIIEKFHLNKYDNIDSEEIKIKLIPEDIRKEPIPEEEQSTKVEKKETIPVKSDTVIAGIEIFYETPIVKKETIQEKTTQQKVVKTHSNLSDSNEKYTQPIVNLTPNKVFKAKEKQYKMSYYPYTPRNVYEYNKTKFLIAKEGDTYAKIAKETQISEANLRNYNDAYKEYEPIEGEVIYLQTKSTKSDIKSHAIEEGDSFRYIAQKYAIQLKVLLKRNENLFDGYSLGDKICIDCN